MTQIDEFYAFIAERLAEALPIAELDETAPSYWAVIEDDCGTECSPLETLDLSSSDVLATFMENGAQAAAIITVVGGEQARLLAYAATRSPATSDVRQARIKDEGGSIRIGPWEPTV